jgi:hypothetical protein
MVSCESDYSKFVKRELATGVKNDSLFFGMKFNDSKKDFFDICKELNEKELVTHGPQNKFVKYNMKSNGGDVSNIQMLFYGIFDKDGMKVFDRDKKMTGLNMRFSYSAWAPWNKNLYSSELIPVLKDTLKKWFPGNEFMTVDIKEINKKTYVKIDGNRQIKMYVLDDEVVAVKIEDLDKKRGYNNDAK